MKIFWVLALVILRPIYFIYSTGCLIVPIFVLYIIVYFFYPHLPSPDIVVYRAAECIFGIAVIFAIAIPALVYSRKTAHDPNPFQSAFMSWYASLRWYWNFVPGPMAKVALPSGLLVENPTSYRINAKDMRAILDQLKPGDILLRAYDGYLDGKLIRQSSLCSKNGFHPGWFTHAALFIGQLDDTDRDHVPKSFQDNKHYFQTGPQMVLHSMAMGVHAEDILTWLRCDYMTVLRLKTALHSDTAATRSETVQNIKLSALEKIGEPYNFECAETGKFNRFSCAEYVYHCFQSARGALGLSPQLHAFYPLGKLNRHFCIMGRNTVTPDDFYRLAQEKHLDVIWIDEISKKMA